MRLLLLILLLLPLAEVAADGDDVFTATLDEATQWYEAGDYDHASEALETIVEAHPECAECEHMLGKAYGRLAEQAGWISAVKLVKKTRVALENAVALDPSNDQALEDLITFYRAAPGFLGGDDDKANELERRLQALRADHTS